MAVETILQYSIIQSFILPFVLVFTLLFAILFKTKVIGDDKQISAIVAAVVALIFVSFVGPKVSVANFMVVLVMVILVVFVGMLIWGFGIGTTPKIEGWPMYVFGALIVIVLAGGLLWATGFDINFDKVFNQSWSESFWSNFLFIAVIAGVIAVVLGTGAAAAKK